MRVANVRIASHGEFSYLGPIGLPHTAEFPLFIIKQAWTAGVSFEDLADGFGEGRGTCGGDWSGIRDSTDQAKAEMLERALNLMTFKR